MLTTALWRRTSMPTGSGPSSLRAALAVCPGSSLELSWVTIGAWALGLGPAASAPVRKGEGSLLSPILSLVPGHGRRDVAATAEGQQ